MDGEYDTKLFERQRVLRDKTTFKAYFFRSEGA